MNNFNLIQAPNGYYYLKYDMGNTYYKGIINPALFFEEIRTNYIEIVKEAIQYFRKTSTNDPSITSVFEYVDGDKNNFIISFVINNTYVKFSKIIKIEVDKYAKTLEEYIGEQEYKFLDLQNTLEQQNKEISINQSKILALENKILELEIKNTELITNLSNIDNRTNDIVKLVLEQLTIHNSKFSSTTGTTNLFQNQQQTNQNTNQFLNQDKNQTNKLTNFNFVNKNTNPKPFSNPNLNINFGSNSNNNTSGNLGKRPITFSNLNLNSNSNSSNCEVKISNTEEKKDNCTIEL